MDNRQTAQQLNDIIGPYLKDQDFVLVELIYRYQGRDLFLRVLADRPEGGITMGECTLLNRRISELLEGTDIIQERFVLEVYSPGADRPMKSAEDFARCLKRKAKFSLLQPVEGKIEHTGVIREVNQGSVFIDTGEEKIEIPLSSINRAKQII